MQFTPQLPGTVSKTTKYEMGANLSVKVAKFEKPDPHLICDWLQSTFSKTEFPMPACSSTVCPLKSPINQLRITAPCTES